MRHLTGCPRSFGFRQPAEWDAHAATWGGWPFDDEEWRGQLEAARTEYAAFARAVANCEPFWLLVADDESLDDAQSRLGSAVRYLRVPMDDVWLRDSGPIFVTRPDDATVSCVHWRFNAWGRKFDWQLDDDVPEAVVAALDLDHFDAELVFEGGSIETNGQGVAITTRQCLLEPLRNPGLTERDLEHVLAEYLGLTRIVWLELGLQGDHTDGHVDTIARFVDEDTVLACVAEDASDPNHDVLAENAARLRAHFKVIEIPTPREARFFGEERLPLTYVNYCLANGSVIVPQYGDYNDDRALEIVRHAFPGRDAIALSSAAIITSGGSFHCLTQHQPQGALWKAPESI